MSSEARDATNAGSTPRSRIASAVTGPTAATRGPARPDEPLAHRRDAVHAREDDPVVGREARDGVRERAAILGVADLDQRHERHLRAEALELLGERLRLGSSDDDAPSG